MYSNSDANYGKIEESAQMSSTFKVLLIPALPYALFVAQ